MILYAREEIEGGGERASERASEQGGGTGGVGGGSVGGCVCPVAAVSLARCAQIGPGPAMLVFCFFSVLLLQRLPARWFGSRGALEADRMFDTRNHACLSGTDRQAGRQAGRQ